MKIKDALQVYAHCTYLEANLWFQVKCVTIDLDSAGRMPVRLLQKHGICIQTLRRLVVFQKTTGGNYLAEALVKTNSGAGSRDEVNTYLNRVDAIIDALVNIGMKLREMFDEHESESGDAVDDKDD